MLVIEWSNVIIFVTLCCQACDIIIAHEFYILLAKYPQESDIILANYIEH